MSAAYFLSSKVHVLLISLMQFDSELVVGPAVLGLTHLSLLPELKGEICKAGALPVLLRLIIYCKNTIILIQCCKLAASLALHPPNQSFLTR